ncbi:hypothetical protein SAMN05444000_111115 [Shimia gijangensis]|uniref:Type IV pilus biogenesis n=1 Tax=Shimia gijangensis TaxID=1470563 RepID=A0A1M6L8I5_9RHOB|nr:hypothetical protein [Shimia gijangensis]SHJ67522.1 hypothetical protein SAMN05444000_111115 [Shimia gijangensis]
MTEKTSTHVAQQATQKAALTRGALTLIGVAGGEDTRRALILLASGRVVTAKMGERSTVGTVVGINETSVVLMRGGKELTLEMPS